MTEFENIVIGKSSVPALISIRENAVLYGIGHGGIDDGEGDHLRR